MNVPQFFQKHSTNFLKIREMAEQFPNDQELGEAIRKFLNSDECNVIYTGYEKDLDQPTKE